MAIHIIVYNVVLACMCVYAWRRGGQPERLAAIGWAVASLATLALPFDAARTFHHVDAAAVAIDLAVLVWFIAIAAVANRFWPMWVSALHLLGVAVHGVKALEPSLVPVVYAFALGKISYPIMFVIAAGVFRHEARVRRSGRYRDWSISRISLGRSSFKL